MIEIKEYPKNKKHYSELIKFGKRIFKLCKNIDLSPIVYGSVAIFAYSKNEKMVVNDIDIYIPERGFKKLIQILKKNKINFKYSQKWHTIIIRSNKLKIEVDSYDFWNKGRAKTKRMKFLGLKTRVLDLKGLKEIYKKASKTSDKPEKNHKKYLALNNLKPRQ